MSTRYTLPLSVTGAAGLALGCWRLLGPERAALLRPHHGDLAALLTGACAWAVTLAASWGLLLLVLVAVEPLVGRDLASEVGCPSWLRPALLALCGLTATAALAGPAHATDHPANPAGPARAVTHGAADGLPVPDRTTSRARPHPATVVVAPGDSMWRITAQRLPEHASAADVAHGWRRLYERNRARIGADPDLIEPGTRLVVPSPTQE